MPLDGYFLNRLKDELKVLTNKRIKKIKMPNKRVIVLEFNSSELGSLYFDLSPSQAHVKLSNQVSQNENHNFLNSLKQKLENSLLKEINQYKKDRILFFEFSKQDPFTGPLKRTLVFEVMGRTAHLILLDENEIIIDSFNKVFNDDKRSILPKLKYEPYFSNKKECSFLEVNLMESPNQIFNSCLGFSKELAYHVYHEKLNLEEMATVPIMYETDKLNFHAYNFSVENKEFFGSLSSLLEKYYETDKTSSSLEKTITKQINNLTHKLSELKNNYLNNENYLFYKDIADQIYASGLNLKSHYSEFEGYLLDYTKTLNENAQDLYKQYSKKKRSLEHLTTQIDLVTDKIEYFSSIKINFPFLNNNDIEDLKSEFREIGFLKSKKQKKVTSPSYEIIKEGNTTFYIGKSSLQNAFLYHKIAKRDDYWFHLKDYPGPHVFMRGELTESNLQKGASLAVKYSKFKNENNVLVNYTIVKNTKRIANKIGFNLQISNYKTITYSKE